MRAFVAGCLALGLLLSGCSGPDEPRSAPAPSAHQSPEASGSTSGPSSARPSAATAAVPGPPPATDDRRGRLAFAEYVLEAWIHALNTNDPAPLLAVSGHRPCDGCSDLAGELRKRDRQGWHVALEGVRVSATDLSSRSGRTTRVVLSVEIPESASYNDDGSFRGTNPAHSGSRFAVEMTHVGGRFRLDSFSLY